MKRITFTLLLTLACCDPNNEEMTTTTTGEGCPVLCTEQTPCTADCLPDACGTIGDWCDVKNGDAQCGERMACIEIPDDDIVWGVCAAPCSAVMSCNRGTCVAGVCREDGALVPPIKCE